MPKTTRKPKRRNKPKMVIRRDAAPDTSEAPSCARKPPRRKRTSPPRPPVANRVKTMSGTHVAAGIGAGTIANTLAVLAVGKQWIGPKTTAGILMGTGALASAAGWYWDADHVMAAGAGVTAAGTFSLANQLAVDMYEAAEKKAAKQRGEREKEAQAKQLEAARQLIAQEASKQQRNAPVLRIVRSDIDEEDTDDRDDDDHASYGDNHASYDEDDAA